MEKMGPSYTVVENVKWCHVENNPEVSQKFNSHRMTWRVHSEAHTQEKWRHYAHTKACIIHDIKSKTIQVSVKTGQTKHSTVWCLNNGILFSKRETSDTRYGMDEPWKRQRSQSQRITYCIWFHLYETSRTGKPTETQSRLVVTRSRGGGEQKHQW